MALGGESAARSIGQIAGPMVGGALLGVLMMVSFWLAGGLLLAFAPLVARGACAHSSSEATLADWHPTVRAALAAGSHGSCAPHEAHNYADYLTGVPWAPLCPFTWGT